MSTVREIKIDDTPVDTLTVIFWQDGPNWCAQVGRDIAAGIGGFAETPLAALADLCKNIAKDEGVRSDNGKVFLR